MANCVASALITNHLPQKIALNSLHVDVVNPHRCAQFGLTSQSQIFSGKHLNTVLFSESGWHVVFWNKKCATSMKNDIWLLNVEQSMSCMFASGSDHLLSNKPTFILEFVHSQLMTSDPWFCFRGL